jgi:alkylation response protein AidB-like acyl-CoA dehydrogenase
MGLRTSPMSEMVLSDCRVPGEALLGKLGSGMAIFNHSMDWERGCILAGAVGSMQRQLETGASSPGSADSSVSRSASSRPCRTGSWTCVRRLEAARLMLYHLGWSMTQTHVEHPRVGNGQALPLRSVRAVQPRCTIQIHGALGYMTEAEIERDLRDAIAGRIYSGTSEIQKNLIARHMGL